VSVELVSFITDEMFLFRLNAETVSIFVMGSFFTGEMFSLRFKSLTDIYKTVTTSFGDLLDGTNSDKTRSMVGAQNGGKILNIEKNSPSDTFLLGGINYNSQHSLVNISQWPKFNGSWTILFCSL
jgi:hypothetical protein